MRILFATGHGFLPQRVGGSESSTNELILALQEEGHDCAVLAQLQGNGLLGLRNRVLMKLSGRTLLSDTLPGYPVYRAWFPHKQAAATVARELPDVALVQSGESLRMAKAFLEAGLPTIVYLRDVEFHELGGDPAELHGVTYIANSHFVAERFCAAFGPRPHVIRPLFRADRYATPRAPKYVTFVNPHPVKGVDLAFEIAALCPEIPFCFVEGWPMNKEEKAELETRVAAQPNVHLQPRTHDMREIYQATHTLLVPSQWEEAWGRVATEAQFSGIPVVASNRGGLPEAVGPGGRILDHDAPPGDWAAVLRDYWRSRTAYAAASAAALEHSKRPEIDARRQVQDLCTILNRQIRGVPQDQPGWPAGQMETATA